ncbi:MAG: HPr family phosphocarrier protein [Clostridia bacterium]|nr:HPr family phosphocarrier protein [Clostridia bacterium]NCC44622.1 HPr family phosphocarrier protein [Clostridia bacterium]
MQEVRVYLNSIDRVKNFVNTISKYDAEFDLISGRYVIDAKSIMGIFSLDLSKTQILQITNGTKEVMAAIAEFMVE